MYILFSILFFIGFNICIPQNIFDKVNIVNRIFDITATTEQEKHDSRLLRYKVILENVNPFIGNGLGSKTYMLSSNESASESYVFQILYEGGFILILSFSLLVFISFYFASSVFLRDIKMLILLIYLSMIIVHAFGSPIFFLFWGILISSFGKPNFLKRSSY